MSWLLLILAALIAWPYLADLFRTSREEARKSVTTGQNVTLSRGVTHFDWHGPDTGPVAVCVHGLTTPSFVWGPIVEGLTQIGFRVLTYDLYGRGASDSPRGLQDADFFTDQLEELLDTQDIGDDLTLLGYSMGGAIVTAFAAKAPKRTRQVILLAPAGLGHDLGPIASLVANHKWLGSWLMMAWYGRSYRQALEEERGIQSAIPDIVDRQMSELDHRGFRSSVLQSLRGILDDTMEDVHTALARSGPPVVAIWGRDDEIIPIAGKETLSEWNPSAKHGVVEGAGHALAYTHHAQVLELLDDLMVPPDGGR